MDPWLLASIILAVALAGVALIARRRGRRLDRIGTLIAGTDPTDTTPDPEMALARLRAATDAAARALVNERAERATLADTVASGLLLADADLRILEVNLPAHELLGRGAGTLVGRSLIEAFLDPEAESIARSAIERGSAGGELRLGGPDGLAIQVRARRSVEDGCWLVLDDVSELRRLQRIRAEFIDNLSHELRTPLTTVSLLAETLARDAETAGDGLPPKMRDRIGKIEVETGHLVQMVSELLDLSRIESGGTLELVDGVDLGRLAGDSAERLRLFAERQGVTLRVDAAPGLPSVRGDAARLGQVIVNLVHNAVKFSPDGGEVVVRARTDGGDVVVDVEDHGVGIPAAARDRVFERFYKVDRARLRAGAGGGTGLGLAIARHVIDQHGGRIWLRSEEGTGSTFSFALPAATGPDG